VSFTSALQAAQSRPTDPDALSEVARTALREGEEERGLAALEGAVADSANARLWQWKGLLERSLDEHEKALASFEAAARLDPADASIAHGLARVALEAGIPAEQLYERARAVAPADGSVLIGLAAARLAAGHGEQAEAELEAALVASPLWIQGHHQLAQLRSMMGRVEQASASLDRALAVQPDQSGLWQALFDLRVKSENFAQLEDAVETAKRTRADPSIAQMYEAIAASELGQTARADSLFARLDSGGADHLPVWLIRHFLRTGRVEQALPIIDRELQGARSMDIWPYAAIAWRLAGDQRWDWVNCGGKLVQIVDLLPKLPQLERLAELLRSIHLAHGEYLDQSLRGGTQTDGPLFSRVEAEVRALRSVVVEAVESYIAELPPADAIHPLLGPRRDKRIRFAGSWSVRLKQEGFHVSHVHPQGWISSALYVALPPATEDDGRAGWLQLGEPRLELGVELKPLAYIKPEPGRLVLFPSWMWHGTIPFPAGERMSVAFDVARPR
jgi:tetratricopeptide (TPR) repeat protein